MRRVCIKLTKEKENKKKTYQSILQSELQVVKNAPANGEGRQSWKSMQWRHIEGKKREKRWRQKKQKDDRGRK